MRAASIHSPARAARSRAATARPARAHVRQAEGAQKAAQAEFRKAEVNRLARLRCLAAAEIDQALSDFSKSWSEYEALGLQLFNVAADDHAGNIHSFTESVDGMLRLAAALPHQPFYDLRWRHSFAPIGTSSSLAAAEAAYWRLPPIESETKEGQALGVNGTPAVFINGRKISGAYPFETFKKIADEELAKKTGKKRGG